MVEVATGVVGPVLVGYRRDAHYEAVSSHRRHLEHVSSFLADVLG